jgi:hypothetical protein
MRDGFADAVDLEEAGFRRGEHFRKARTGRSAPSPAAWCRPRIDLEEDQLEEFVVREGVAAAVAEALLQPLRWPV